MDNFSLYKGCMTRDFKYNDNVASLENALKRIADEPHANAVDLSAPQIAGIVSEYGEEVSSLWKTLKDVRTNAELFKCARMLKHACVDTIDDNLREGSETETAWEVGTINACEMDNIMRTRWRVANRALNGVLFLTRVLSLV